jgi:hypothetical protein
VGEGLVKRKVPNLWPNRQAPSQLIVPTGRNSGIPATQFLHPAEDKSEGHHPTADGNRRWLHKPAEACEDGAAFISRWR